MGTAEAPNSASGRAREKRAQAVLIPLLRSELRRCERLKLPQSEHPRFIECLATLDPSASNLDALGGELEKYFMDNRRAPQSFCHVARRYYGDGPASVDVPRILKLCSLAKKSMALSGCENTYAIRDMAFLYSDVGEHKEALACTRRSLALNPEFDPVGMFGIQAESLEKLGKRSEALLLLDEVIRTKSPAVKQYLERFISAAKTAGYPEDAALVERKYLGPKSD